jgi:hypothetical protein
MKQIDEITFRFNHNSTNKHPFLLRFKNKPNIMLTELSKMFISLDIFFINRYYSICYGCNYIYAIHCNTLMSELKEIFTPAICVLNIRHEEYYIKSLCQELLFNHNELV